MDYLNITVVAFSVLLFAFAFAAGYFFGRVKERNEPKNASLESLLPRCTCKNPRKTWCKGCLMREVASMEGGEK